MYFYTSYSKSDYDSISQPQIFDEQPSQSISNSRPLYYCLSDRCVHDMTYSDKLSLDGLIVAQDWKQLRSAKKHHKIQLWNQDIPVTGKPLKLIERMFFVRSLRKKLNSSSHKPNRLVDKTLRQYAKSFFSYRGSAIGHAKRLQRAFDEGKFHEARKEFWRMIPVVSRALEELRKFEDRYQNAMTEKVSGRLLPSHFSNRSEGSG